MTRKIGILKLKCWRVFDKSIKISSDSIYRIKKVPVQISNGMSWFKAHKSSAEMLNNQQLTLPKTRCSCYQDISK